MGCDRTAVFPWGPPCSQPCSKRSGNSREGHNLSGCHRLPFASSVASKPSEGDRYAPPSERVWRSNSEGAGDPRLGPSAYASGTRGLDSIDAQAPDQQPRPQPKIVQNQCVPRLPTKLRQSPKRGATPKRPSCPCFFTGAWTIPMAHKDSIEPAQTRLRFKTKGCATYPLGFVDDTNETPLIKIATSVKSNST